MAASTQSQIQDRKSKIRLPRVNPGVTTTHTWDKADRLTSVAATGSPTVTMAYDGDSKRTKKTAAGVEARSTWDVAGLLPNVVQERDSADQVAVSYALGLDLLMEQTGANRFYYHSDGLGSARAITDQAKTVVNRYEYDAFGAQSSTDMSGAPANSFRFTAQQLDAELGLYYLRARYYDPGVGRFLSRDPMLPGYTDPQSINGYAYVRNSPTTLVDPSGHFLSAPVVIGAFIGGAIGGVQAYQQTGGDWSQVAKGAFIGAVAGGVGAVPFVGGIGATLAVGAASGFAGNVATQAVLGKGWSEIDWGSAIISGVSGVAGAGVGALARPTIAKSTPPTWTLVYNRRTGLPIEVMEAHFGPNLNKIETIQAVVSGAAAGGFDIAAQALAQALAPKPAFAAEGQPAK